MSDWVRGCQDVPLVTMGFSRVLVWRERYLTELRGFGWKLLDEADVLYVESTSSMLLYKEVV